MKPFNNDSPRAQKARLAKLLAKKSAVFSQKIIFWLGLAAGGGAVTAGQVWGYLFLSLSAAALCIILWRRGELDHLRSYLITDSIDGVLDPKILANIRASNPSAFDVWQAAKDTEARYFIQNRFILHPSIFDNFLPKEPGTANLVWEHCEVLRQKYKRPDYHAVIVVVALLRVVPNAAQLLRQAKLDINEIESGIGWMLDIEAKRELVREKQRFGGWARDWTYGYTPILSRLGHNLSREVELYGFFEDSNLHAQVVDQMIAAMGSGNSAISLVGELGSGKTTCVYAFAEKLLKPGQIPPRIKHNQVVALDAPSLISQARNPGELEGLMIRIVNEAIKAKNIILFFDDAYVFFSHGTGSVDLSKVLQPVVESGGIKIIFAMTPKELQQLNTINGAVTGRLQLLQVPPADEQNTIHVLRDKVLSIEYQKKVLFTQQALKEAYRLGSRYIDGQAMPGAALSVLQSASTASKDGYITAEVVQSSIEASVGVKLRNAQGDESDRLLNLESELHKFVISQRHAVSVIANALRRSRSGVANPEKPVGTFLFLGPTGVGKTELSKALARVYFGSEDAIVRADMNQFVQPQDATRLITPMLGDQLGFLGEIRRSPFSVVLLDEIEKAHPNVINLLLQMLDEGVMRDSDNKAVSFKDAIIIATSNAGANDIRAIIQSGGDVVKAQEEIVDKIINDKIFAPEFINRFDEVVVFEPLKQEDLMQVIDIIIASINKTLDSQKVQVTLTDQAKRWLVEKGYDERLGARPMRRVVQKYVENIMAKKLLQNSAASGSIVQLDVADFVNNESN